MMRHIDRITQQVQALTQVPMPSEQAIAHSERLFQAILSHCPMSFLTFMQQALYAPGLGYYSAGSLKIGPAGDFITAPEISPFFGAALANQAQQILTSTGGSILEFGAGTGALADSILKQLENLNSLPDQYLILEPSPDLQQRQQQRLAQSVPDLYDRIVWLEQLPADFSGLMIANEVLDAMPVHCFRAGPDKIEMMRLLDEAGEITSQFTSDVDAELADWWLHKGKNLALPEGYQSEVNLMIKPWLEGLNESLSSGMILLLDYGFPESEYYHAQRTDGTLKCHYRHHHHDDPLKLIGLQDITAHVNFTEVAEAAHSAGLEVLGYANQGSFLTSCGIVQLAEQQLSGELKDQLLTAQQIKPLIMPEEMGELFKVMALGKNLDTVSMGGLIGFQFLDQRHHL